MVFFTIDKLVELVRSDSIVTELDGRNNISICVIAGSQRRMQYIADTLFDLFMQNGYDGYRSSSSMCSVIVRRGIRGVASYSIYVKIATEKYPWRNQAGTRCHVFAVEQDAFDETFCDATKTYVSDKDTAYIPVDVDFFINKIYRAGRAAKIEFHSSSELDKYFDEIGIHKEDDRLLFSFRNGKGFIWF